ncbi:hypothetical protein BGW36DRAFT_256662, partial [Talaromyces proteolyticus]
PPVPCSYCRHWRLQCLILNTSAVNPNPIRSCSSCVALFRECSLSRGEKRQPSDFETLTPVYGHMHGLTEEQLGEAPSRQREEVVVEEEEEEEEEGKKTTTRRIFSRKGGRVLQNWFYRHQEYPYPTEEQKTSLAQESGLSKRQVSNWFANARRRHKQHFKQKETLHVYRSGSPMPRTDGFALMTPMERWKSSPPEDEPVSKSTIRKAIASTNYNGEARNIIGGPRLEYSTDDSTSHPSSSMSSFGTGRSESSESLSSAWSYQSSNGNWPSLHATSPGIKMNGCTFCRYSAKKRHDWVRHEKSIHLSLESWCCTPDLEAVRQATELPSVEIESQNSPVCALCGQDSSPTHCEDAHDFGLCADRPLSERTFGRKDHLWQHLHKFHHCNGRNIPPQVVEGLDKLCRTERHEVPSRCGFCEATLQTWDQRADHLAAHFKHGFRMSQWRGDWGLEEPVLQDLREAVLPWER